MGAVTRPKAETKPPTEAVFFLGVAYALVRAFWNSGASCATLGVAHAPVRWFLYSVYSVRTWPLSTAKSLILNVVLSVLSVLSQNNE